MDKTSIRKIIMKYDRNALPEILPLFTFIPSHLYEYSNKDIGWNTEYKYTGPLKFDIKRTRSPPKIFVDISYYFNMETMTRTEEINSYKRYVHVYDPNKPRFKAGLRVDEVFPIFL